MSHKNIIQSFIFLHLLPYFHLFFSSSILLSQSPQSLSTLTFSLEVFFFLLLGKRKGFFTLSFYNNLYIYTNLFNILQKTDYILSANYYKMHCISFFKKSANNGQTSVSGTQEVHRQGTSWGLLCDSDLPQKSGDTVPSENSWICSSNLKGIVSRDFQPLVFFMNRTHLVSCFIA